MAWRRASFGGLVAAVLLSLLRIAAIPAGAAGIDTWRGGGGDSNWADGANWLGGAPPSSGDALVFPASPYTATDNDLVGYSFSGVTFSASGYDISGNAFTLTGPLVVSAAVTSGQDEIDPAVTLTGSGIVSVLSGGATLELTAPPSGALTKTGDGTLDAEGLDADTWPVTVKGGVLTGCGGGGSSASPIIVKAGASYVAGSAGTSYPLITCPRPLTLNGTGYEGQGALDVLQNVELDTLTLGSDSLIEGSTSSSTYWFGTVTIGSHTLTVADRDDTMAGGIRGTGTLVANSSTETLVEGSGSLGAAVVETRLGLAIRTATVTVDPGAVLWTVSTITSLSVPTTGSLWPCDLPVDIPPTAPGTPTVTKVTNSLTLPSGASYTAELGVGTAAGNDSLKVTEGTLDIAGATLAIDTTGAACDGYPVETQVGDRYTILSVPGGIAGTFAGLSGGSVISGDDGGVFRIAYHPTSVVLTRVS